MYIVIIQENVKVPGNASVIGPFKNDLDATKWGWKYHKTHPNRFFSVHKVLKALNLPESS